MRFALVALVFAAACGGVASTCDGVARLSPCSAVPVPECAASVVVRSESTTDVRLTVPETGQAVDLRPGDWVTFDLARRVNHLACAGGESIAVTFR